MLRSLRGGGATGLTHGEVTRRLIMSVPDVTRMMDRLVSQGLVSRSRAVEDRRKVIHRITDAGLALLGGLDPELTALQDRFATALGSVALTELVSYCERVIELVRTGAVQGEGGER